MSTSRQPSPPAGKARRRHYEEQFKRDAVALIEAGRPMMQLARELGISHWNLRDWKERYGAGAAAAGLPARSAVQACGGEAGSVALAACGLQLTTQIGQFHRQPVLPPWFLRARRCVGAALPDSMTGRGTMASHIGASKSMRDL